MICVLCLQAQAPQEDDFHVDQNIPPDFSQQDSSASSAFPAREAAAGFKGAFKKVANGIAGDTPNLMCFTGM